MKKPIIISVILMVLTFVVQARECFVTMNGNDNNPGTKNLPFGSIFKASETAMPGDTVTIFGGEYKLQNQFKPVRSGNAEQWILYRAAPNESAIFDGSLIKKVIQKGDSVQFSRQTAGLFQIEKVNYLRFENIEVQKFGCRRFYRSGTGM